MKCVLLVLLMASTAQAASLKKIVKPFAKLSTLTILSAEFDAATTYRAVRSGRAYEANVLVRPFARNASIFPVLGATAVGVNYLSSWMKKNNHQKLGKTLQILCIGSHIAGGATNLHTLKTTGY
ncbi:MAG: hypothetical protein M1404_06140 [Acidobacteria bacterium]|nr:hypothetical protein [Acidobacteriota bacterium]